MANKKMCTCEVCGKEFEGYSRSRYCRECKPAAVKENQRRFYAKQAEAKAEAAAKTQDEAEKKPALAEDRPEWLDNPDQKQCVGCKYRAPLHSRSSGEQYCDYMRKHAEEKEKIAKEQGLPWDGHMERRKHDGPVCLSRAMQ